MDKDSSIERLLASVRYRKRARKRERKFQHSLRTLDKQARRITTRVRGATLLNPDKLFALIQATRHVGHHGVEGDIVECGVWRGGAVMASALTLLDLGVTDRTFYLYDTFEGMLAPMERDFSLLDGADAREEFERTRVGETGSSWCRATIDDVRANLASIPYPSERFIFVRGKVEDTLPGTLPGRIALLHLDTDWYESTRHELIHLMPLLVPGGVLIVDDYFRWAGNRDAVDEYLARQKLPILLTKVGRSAIGVRP